MTNSKPYDPWKSGNVNPVDPTMQSAAYGQSYLNNVNEMQVGSGQTVLHADRSGFWLGSERFANAPFSVDMDGNVNILSQNGSAKIVIDAVNSRIVVYDEAGIARVLLGRDDGGF